MNRLKHLSTPVSIHDILDTTICQDIMEAIRFLPSEKIDLVFADPPYNLTKDFHGNTFLKTDLDLYEEWMESWVKKIKQLMKPTASIYICGDWRSSSSIHRVLARHFIVRNRISWEREKGRGAAKNWKNNIEDIWFASVSDNYTFNIDEVKIKRRVIAPYKDNAGKPKDWETANGGKYRITYPSNIWTDITIPFWSMPENTDHPTQKPEKLLAKIILASSNAGDIVFDPFLGSGTTSVVAKKLGRRYVGVEMNQEYCCFAEARLRMAETDKNIQGYTDGVFWERNTLSEQINNRNTVNATGTGNQQALFEEY